MFISADDVLAVLRHHIWMSGNEIREEVYKAKGKKRQWFSGDILYVTLAQLEEEGLIESRERAFTLKKLIMRGGRGEREYKLTEDGIRRRIESSQSNRKLIGGLVPES